MAFRRLVTRTIKNGSVRIHGKIYYPYSYSQGRQYADQLEGIVYVFGLYQTIDGQANYVNIWGTKELDDIMKRDFASFEAGYDDHDPRMNEDGSIDWDWWYTADELARMNAEKSKYATF